MASLYKKLSEERKQLQAEGRVPEWYSTAGYQLFKDKYLYEADDVRGQFARIARTAAKHLSHINMEEEAYENFFNLLWKGWLSPSTPVLSNMGTNRGLPVSCSGGYIGDSVHGFYTARLEAAMLTKYGFGTSGYLGNIRSRGEPISVGGKASGVVPVFKGFVQDMRDIAQGTARRGAWAGYLEIDHGDFDELADHIMAEPDDANVGWIISNEFLLRLESGDEDAIRRYQKAMKMKMVLGKGYFFFNDKANDKRPKMYVDKGLTVKNSNLCLTGDTIITVKGSISGMMSVRLDTFVNELAKAEDWEIWSYDTDSKIGEWKPVTDFAMTNPKAKLMKITDEETGKSIKCTHDHKIFTKNRGYVMAKDLNADDELVIG